LFRTFIYDLTDRLHRLTLVLCVGLLAVSLASQLVTVVLRYGFSRGYLWLQDLSLWSFSAMLMLAIPVALALDAHVRVDVLREAMTRKGRDWLDRFAIVFLLAPLFGLIGWLTLPEAVGAWQSGESSPQIGGLAGYWIVRWVPVIAAVLTLIQGAARLARPTGAGA
jgi:TRAP-type mannitol/chloroaromatic compound transport system permease small subunit